VLPVYRCLADRIAQDLGRRVELVTGTSFEQLERGDADLGVICGLPYVWLAARNPAVVEPLAAPVLAGVALAGRPSTTATSSTALGGVLPRPGDS
jgi:hypothetical protein